MPAKVIRLPDSMQNTHEIVDGKIVRKPGVTIEQSRPKLKKGWQHNTWLNFLAGTIIVLGGFYSIQQSGIERQIERDRITECVNLADNEQWFAQRCDRLTTDPLYQELYRQKHL